MTYTLYTDGCCLGNPGPGGTGVHVLFSESDEKKESRGYHQTTNNRMELRAAIDGLKAVRGLIKIYGRGRIEWFTDSKYVADNIYNVQKWRKGNVWMTGTGEPVLNVDLWRELEAIRSSLGIYPSWISREENKVTDGLAKLAAKNPTHTDFGYNPGRVGTSLGTSKKAPIFYKETEDELQIRIYKGDGQISRSQTFCKIRFEIIDTEGNVSNDKYYAYARSDIYSELHRHHKYTVSIADGHITGISKEIV